jgi:hypothetical protein
MSFLRHGKPHQADERLNNSDLLIERARPRGHALAATPSLIVLMSLQLVVPGGLLSSIARFRSTNRG